MFDSAIEDTIFQDHFIDLGSAPKDHFVAHSKMDIPFMEWWIVQNVRKGFWQYL